MTRSIAACALIALATLTAAPANASPTDDVRAAMLKFAGLHSYEMSFGSGAKSGIVDFINPDTIRMSSQGSEMVHVGNMTYMKMNGKWQKFSSTARAGEFGLADHVRKMATEANGVSATDLGMKSVGGEMLHAYKMTQKDGQTGIIFVGNDGLPHRLQGGGPDANDTVTISKFNAVAPIRAPI